MVFWTLRLCISWNICTNSSLAVLSQLFSHTGLLRELFVFACCWLCSCFMGSWVATPGCLLMGSRVPIPGCFTFFTAIWRVFHQPNPMNSMPTSPSESLLLFNPWNQLNFNVTGFKNTQASRDNSDNRSRHFPRTSGIVHNTVDVLNLLHLLSRELDRS